MRTAVDGAIAATPSIPAWLSIPSGMPWWAAFSLSFFGLTVWAGMSFFAEWNRHAESLLIIAKDAELSANQDARSRRPSIGGQRQPRRRMPAE